MSTWQRRARLVIAVGTVAFAIVVAIAFRPRTPDTVVVPPLPPTDPEAVVESASGTTIRVNREEEEVRVDYDKLLSYPDGVTRMVGMRVTTVRAEGRTFVLSGNEGEVKQNPNVFDVKGDVQLATDDGLEVRGSEASYAEGDGVVRAPGPVSFKEGRMSGTSVGLTYDKGLDSLNLLEKAVVTVTPDAKGADGVKVQAGRAEFRRTAHTVRFEEDMKIASATQVMQADTGTAFLGGEEGQLQRIELRGSSNIAASRPVPGGLRTLSGVDMDLEYAEDGRTLHRAAVRDDAVIVLAGERGSAGRRISAERIDIVLGADGETPIEVRADGAARVVLPGANGRPGRTVAAQSVDASGAEEGGLTAARFEGGVVFREEGKGVDRTVRSRTLDAALGPGLGEIEEARFAGNVRFAEGRQTAMADEAAYGVAKGTLALRPSSGSDAVPRLVDERLAVEAREIDIGLDGDQIVAKGAVKSELTPAPARGQADPKTADARRVPSMLRDDQPVIVVADELTYDGRASRAAYNGNVRLSQGDTSIKGSTMTLDEKTGDLQAAGEVVTTTVLDQVSEGGRRDRVPSIARAGQFAYEEKMRRATYTEDAQVGGPHGEMRARRIELYLRPSGNELERVEAYEDVALLEQRRRTSGTRLTYFSDDNRYVVIGTPVTIVDECGRETTGRTLTFYQNTDRVVVDGNEQIRTRTTGTSTCP